MTDVEINIYQHKVLANLDLHIILALYFPSFLHSPIPRECVARKEEQTVAQVFHSAREPLGRSLSGLPLTLMFINVFDPHPPSFCQRMGEIKGPFSRSVLSLDFWQNKQHFVTKAGHTLAELHPGRHWGRRLFIR